jgi:two-component system chemotaxis sensor kinase CheA
MTQFSDERSAEMRELFFETAQELLQSLNDEALKLEKHPADAELVRSLRRIVHTLKGDAAACGFRELSNAAHALEDALALESAAAHSGLVEVAFAAADTFANMLRAYRHKGKAPSAASLGKMIRALSQSPKAGKRSKKARPAPAPLPDWTEYEMLATQDALSKGKHVYHLTAFVDPKCVMPIAARQLLLNALKTSAEVLATRPQEGSPDCSKRLELLLATSKTKEQLTLQARIPTVISRVSAAAMKGTIPATKAVPAELARDKASGAAPASYPAAHEASEDHARGGQGNHVPVAGENIVRVDAERIDSVLNLVGELIIGKSMLQQAFSEFARHVPKEALRGRFSDAMAFQSRVLSDLQRSVMKIRMVPVEQLFRRFPRMVRDVAKQCGKEVELVMSGQDTDLDKSLLDVIAEPLAHLVRNAVSHGIESAEQRARSGKLARGTIHLTSYHHGNQVIVEISDDGAGIDVRKVKAKALEQKLITPEDAELMNQSEILELIFRPGFSTADEITEISGRGVGLDVVQTVLHRLKGSVEIETRASERTTFRLKLPLTLAIIKALMFRVENRLYAIPLNSVAEIARARESDVHQVHNQEVLQLRDRVLPLVRLGRAPSAATGSTAQKIFVLVSSLGERKLGLIVDSLEGEEELVIKALDDQTVATDLISGASILGDGRVVLIVNLPAIVDRHNRSRPQAAGEIVSGMLLSHSDRKNLAKVPAEVRP